MVGLLLVFATVLKAVELVTVPTAALAHPLGRYYLPAQIGLELAFGIVALVLSTGVPFAGCSRPVRRLRCLLTLFSVGGAASCGCFGPIHVSPWWTFGLDLAVVSGLLVSAFSDGVFHEAALKTIESSSVGIVSRQRQLVVAGVTIATLSTALLMRYADQRTAVAGGLASVGDLVILAPEEWIGQALPISDSIDVDLSQGEWVVLLHRHDCPACQEEVPQYEERAAAGERVAFVEVPPYGEAEKGSKRGLCGRLRETHEWFVQTPVEILLHDGFVTAVKTHDH